MYSYIQIYPCALYSLCIIYMYIVNPLCKGSIIVGFLQIFFFIFLLQNERHCIYRNGELKGVFAKNERGYRLNAIKKRF